MRLVMTFAVLLWVWIWENEPRQILADILHESWLGFEALDANVHDMRQDLVLVSEELVEEDNLKLLFESRLLCGHNIAPLLPFFYVDLIALGS